MKINKQKGISLIVLVITIIVIIILAGAVILSLANNNPINSANSAIFKSNISEYNSELSLYIANKYAINTGNYDPTLLNADKTSATYNEGAIIGIDNIVGIITSMKVLDTNKFKILSGKLVYIGTDETEAIWAGECGISANIDVIAPILTFGTNGGSGEIVSTTVTVSDSGSGVNISTLQYVWDTQNTITPGSGWTTFTNGDTLTKTGVSGTYYLWIQASDNVGNNVISKTNNFTLIQDYVESEGVNKPLLATGMTAKKWNGSSWDTVSDPIADTSWYDYANKEWANAQTADGSMWVWIPRYEYKITTPHNSTAQTIAINFLVSKTTTATSGYTIHPAFTFGSTELTGIWIAKFEASGNVTAVDAKPGLASLRNITIDTIFTACRNMETTNGSRYGWGTTGTGIDTHLMKNTEWGAVAYLSQSIYGKNSEVWINPNSNHLTGQAGTSVSATGTTSTYSYDNLTYGVKASTTGNVYGIYDMSGGSWEYTAAYVNNNNSKLTTYGPSLVSAEIQYKDVYISSGDTQSGNYSASASKLGDAVYETSSSGNNATSWYGDYSGMSYSNYPFLMRGGFYSDTTSAGLFNFCDYDGIAGTNMGFRPALAVSSSL